MENSEYNDDPSEVYSFREGTPESLQLIEAEDCARFVYLKNNQFYAKGEIGAITSEEHDGATHYRVTIEEYDEIEPIALGAIENTLKTDFSDRNKITKINQEDYNTIVDDAKIQKEGPAYETVGDAYVDVRNRLQETNQEEWLIQQPADAVIGGWTDALEELEVEATLSWEAAAKLKQLVDLYKDFQPRLATLAVELRAGHLEDLSGSETLFVVLIRDLQQRCDFQMNFTAEKFKILNQGAYTIRFPDEGDTDPSETPSYIDPPEPPKEASRIERQLQKTKQLVFYGPPGTSKTYTAQRFAQWWVAQQDTIRATTDQIRTVTFHPSFSYEDFVEGLTAKSGADGSVEYSIQKGIFRDICEDAISAYEDSKSSKEVPRYVLIIDELNRGNLSQIFGELITILEADKRIDETNHTVTDLAHSGKPFSIPPNLYLIGTMNTADRSIALVDTAIRRRFRFLSFTPDYSLLLDKNGFDEDIDTAINALSPETELETALRALSILGIKQLNSRILESPDMDKGKQIGHTYLLNLEDETAIADTWQYEILPLLEEYYYSQFDRIREDLFAGEGEHLINWKTEEIRDFSPHELAIFLIKLTDQNIPELLRKQSSQINTNKHE
ncbi:McrB family protein [Natronorubrum thiooxidans]|uniref:McrB family protein n=1 Tax=Natronorubrum thiooxidans TaxID=308853 RepID=UPI00117DAC08|nr:AAA family ATPase [Natronorubrum thiooxidans]